MGNLNVGDWIDVVACFVLAWGFGRGLFRGPYREVLSVVGSIVALVVAFALYQPAYAWTGFDFQTGRPTIGHPLWFLILFVGTVVLFRLADLGIRKFTDRTGGLSPSSRLWGGAVGASKSAFLVVLLSFFVAALPLSILGQKLSVVEKVRGSRTIRFAESNQWIVRWISRTNLVGGLRDSILDGASSAMAEALVPTRDPEIEAQAKRAFHLALEDPERIEHLGDSSTARDFAARLDAHPGFAEFLRTSPGVARAEEDGEVTLAEVKEILSTEEESIEILLDDPTFREILLSIDLDRIAGEIAASTP